VSPKLDTDTIIDKFKHYNLLDNYKKCLNVLREEAL